MSGQVVLAQFLSAVGARDFLGVVSAGSLGGILAFLGRGFPCPPTPPLAPGIEWIFFEEFVSPLLCFVQILEIFIVFLIVSSEFHTPLFG